MLFDRDSLSFFWQVFFISIFLLLYVINLKCGTREWVTCQKLQNGFSSVSLMVFHHIRILCDAKYSNFEACMLHSSMIFMFWLISHSWHEF